MTSLSAAHPWPAALWLVRHGESEGNIAHRTAYAAKADSLDVSVNDAEIELSELGRRQAAALGRWLGKQDPAEQPTVALVSPYVRARQTAEVVLEIAGLALPTVLDERLRDREQGIMDRLTWQGWQRRFPEEADRRRYLGKFWYRPPGGESWADVALRVRAALRDARDDLAGERILLVAHDVPVLLVRYVLEGLPIEETVALSGTIANCSLTTYRAGADGLELERFNDVSPLAELEAPVTARD